MHVVVCFVIPPLFLPWQLDFASPRSHYCMNVTECFCLPLPPFEFANGFRFTAIPLLHELHCLVCIPLPFYVFAKWLSLHSIRLLCACQVLHVPCFTHYGVPRGPLSKAFWTSEGPKCPQKGLKMGPFHPFVHPKWSRMRFGKMRF